ncbi:MAG: sensor domain-containing diguanylate cyclase [Lachnospiraceae bacterium]|jgi:diguanylate cyclase (GGDEF)-like protein|nr:sensor domain-containing diguanylate cyclase [Lachnospiraceae bacterium]
MREEQKRIIKQWSLPVFALVLVIVGMIINFNSTSSRQATEAVERDIIVIAERYASNLNASLRSTANAARLAAEMIDYIGADQTSREEAALSLLPSLNRNSEAFLAVFCDGTGVGVNSRGDRVNLSNTDYFADLMASGNNSFVYVPAEAMDGIASIVHVYSFDSNNLVESYSDDDETIDILPSPTSDGDWILTFYSLENLADSIRRTDMDGYILYMLMDENGEILAYNRNIRSNFTEETSLIAKLRRSYANEIRIMDRRILNGTSGSLKVAIDGEARTLAYTPLPMNKWYVMIGVNENFVSRMEDREWELSRRMLLQLAIVIAVFTILMVVISMVAKLRSTANTKELMQKADTDLLTGLLNKVATEQRVGEYMASNPAAQAVMFVLDIDNFKKINDTMGHAFGDEVLRSLGQQLSPIFRSSDVVGRIGGDEIIILLKHISTDEIVIKEATKVARFFHEFKAGEYVKYAATASIGAAIFPRDGKDFETIYKAADQALYKAKKRGKNQLAFYNDSYDPIVIK